MWSLAANASSSEEKLLLYLYVYPLVLGENEFCNCPAFGNTSYIYTSLSDQSLSSGGRNRSEFPCIIWCLCVDVFCVFESPRAK